MAKSILVIDSLEKALEPIGTECPDCTEFPFGNGDWTFKFIEREGNNLIYRCEYPSFNYNHRLIARINFKLPKAEILRVAKELHDYVAENRVPKDNTRQELDRFCKKHEELTTKLKNYAQLLPEGKEVKAPGQCYHCSNDAELTIKDGKIWYACSPCAMVIADGAD